METYISSQPSVSDLRNASVATLSSMLDSKEMAIERFTVRHTLWNLATTTGTLVGAVGVFCTIAASSLSLPLSLGLVRAGSAVLMTAGVAAAFAANKKCLKSERDLRLANLGLEHLASGIAHNNPAAHAKIVKQLSASANPKKRELARICEGKMPHRLAL